MTVLPSGAAASRPFVLEPGEAAAYWMAGTYWSVITTGNETAGRSCSFEELCPRGVVAPLHVHDDEEEGFYIVEGDFLFTVGPDQIAAGPGCYVYLPPKVTHGFSVRSEIGRVLNTLTPAGFERGIVDAGIRAQQRPLPPPGTSVLPLWRELRVDRPPAPWENRDEDAADSAMTGRHAPWHANPDTGPESGASF